MEECKELFQNKSQKAVKKAVEALRGKLNTKKERIKELASEITEEEAQEMLEILEKKFICYEKCKKLFLRANQLGEKKSTNN